MKIDIILPYKEIFSTNKASAVSLTIKNSAEFSDFKSKINVFGQYTELPFIDVNFTGIKVNKFFHLGKNRSILFNYLKIAKNFHNERKIIEMHNRPYIFNLACRKEKKNPITMHFHNDPRAMKGSKTVSERISIATEAAAVYFVSEYIRNCFTDGIKQKFDNLHIIPNGIQRRIITQPIKRKEILFIGRLVREKGCHLFINAISNIVKEYPDWKFKIIGTPKAGQNKVNSVYAQSLIKNFKLLGDNTEYLGFISNERVQEILNEISILIVPSIWQEPFALTALEGMCSGSAVIASKVGGMREMLEGTGLLIENINEKILEKKIRELIENKALLKHYQNKSWFNYKYNQSEIVKNQDLIRKKIFSNFNF